MTKIKCTLVGSFFVGKSTLIKTFLNGSYHGFFQPAVYDFYCIDIMYENTMIHLKIQDTNHSESIENASKYDFHDTNIFIVCFSLVCPNSLEKIHFYVDYIKKRFRKSVLFFVGLKSDIRDDIIQIWICWNKKKAIIQIALFQLK